MSGSIERYAFEDSEGVEQSFTTLNPDEAREYARVRSLRVIAQIFEFSDSEPVSEWDFTETGE